MSRALILIVLVLFCSCAQSMSAALFKRTRAADSVSSLTYIMSASLRQAFCLLKTRREKVSYIHVSTQPISERGGGTERYSLEETF